ncbi:MAG TPA: helix-turn-helix domain-containing protein, partial [Geobacterales bacterium]|nr:helix-turn-helix domain-containing protein [Geobacterales bacterium]
LMTHFAENSRGGERTVIQLVTDRDDLATFIASITNFSGPVLRQIREKRRVDLRDVAQSSKIRKGYLVDIELENFSTLPSEIYLKGYLTSYAQFFGLDSRRVVDDYMRRYRSWQESRA